MQVLDEIVREKSGKPGHEMLGFFQGMIEKGDLKAYKIEEDKRISEAENRYRNALRIIEGISLVPVKAVREYEPYFIRDSETESFYRLIISTTGGSFTEEGDFREYHDCFLNRIAEGQIQSETEETTIEGLICIPKEKFSGLRVDARLRMNYTEEWEYDGESDSVAGANGSIIIEGEEDSLLKKVYDFVKNN